MDSEHLMKVIDWKVIHKGHLIKQEFKNTSPCTGLAAIEDSHVNRQAFYQTQNHLFHRSSGLRTLCIHHEF